MLRPSREEAEAQPGYAYVKENSGLKRVKLLSSERIGGKTSPARAQYLRLPRRGEIGSEF